MAGQTKYGRHKVFLYYFDYRTPRTPHGAPHGSEVPYVFGNDPERYLFGPGGEARLRDQPVSASDVALSDLMSRYWVNFARTGNPNGPGLPHWPAFNASSQRVMYLDAHPHAGPVPNMRHLKVLDQYFAWRREEAEKTAAN